VHGGVCLRVGGTGPFSLPMFFFFFSGKGITQAVAASVSRYVAQWPLS
jgi:hypothetical protein